MRQFLLALTVLPALSGMARAENLNESLRPAARPDDIRLVADASQAIETATRLSTAPTTVGPGLRRSLRPVKRPAELKPASFRQSLPEPERTPGFSRWLEGFRKRAVIQGIEAGVFDAAFARAGFLPKVIERDRNQSEFTLSMGAYLGRAASDTRVENGREKAREQARTLAAIEREYGVPAHIVTAVWGMESNYGSNRGDMHLISALATLAYEGRRGAFFEKQLLAALQILQSGDTTADLMRASWAGAMGHTQFIPTSYLAYAVDFTGDGRRDIWSDDPTDALASTAAYLARAGWVRGMPWGVEVKLSDGFNYDHAADKRMPSDWARLGVRGMDGQPVSDYGAAKLLLPAGANGPAFLVFKNFDVIKRYNASNAYALGVGHLGDRIAGAGPLISQWPEGERSLRRAEARELQTLLTRSGYSTRGVDGRIGPNTVKAIRAYQKASGMPADGHPSPALLDRLRR